LALILLVMLIDLRTSFGCKRAMRQRDYPKIKGRAKSKNDRKQACEDKLRELCSLPLDAGLSRNPWTHKCSNGVTGQSKWMFHFQHASGCKSFKYLGCGGNSNRFSTVAKCEQKCGRGQFKEIQDQLKEMNDRMERFEEFQAMLND